MGYRFSLLIMVLFAFSLASTLLPKQFFTVQADTGFIRVPSDFLTIQEAINAAPNGATILVSSGVYIENVNVNKTLTLLGADKQDTIIVGSTNSQGYSEAVAVTVVADDVTISGFTVRNCWGATIGIRLDNSTGSVVSGNIITKAGKHGILLFHSDSNTVSDNIISYTGTSPTAGLHGEGIALSGSDNNTIQNNLITDSYIAGLYILDGSTNNSVLGNTIGNNDLVFILKASANNTIFQNNILNFISQPFLKGGDFSPGQNNWSSKGEGNYWGDYAGLDDGSNGRTAGDGVGDTDLPWHGVDDYPLIAPANPIRVFWDNKAFPTSLASNSTVSAFTFDQPNKEISFMATGPANTTGYFNVSIPKTLLNGSWTVMLSRTDVTSSAIRVENATHTMIFLSYNQSSQKVELTGTHVIPEYQLPVAGFLVLLLSIQLITMSVRKKLKRSQ